MGLLDFLHSKPRNSASVAKDRLRIIVAQERNGRGGPDYLPLLRSELLAVIMKYTKVDIEAVHIELDHEGGQDVLELSVTLPEHFPPTR